MSSLDATKWIGAAAGILLAVALVLSWKVPAEGRPLPAEVSLRADPSGELELRPASDFLSAERLEVGGRAASGRVLLHNITPVTLAVRVRLEPSSPALDRALLVRLESDGGRLAEARLGALRRWSTRSLRIRSGRSAVLRARVWLPAGPSSAPAGGQDVDIVADFWARPVGHGG
jgi:hypothetical protein